MRTLIRRLARTNEALLGQSPGRSNDMKAEADAQESTVVLPRKPVGRLSKSRWTRYPPGPLIPGTVPPPTR